VVIIHRRCHGSHFIWPNAGHMRYPIMKLCQQSINNILSCILGNQGFAQINELTIALLTAFRANNTTYNRKNMYSKIINAIDCKTCKKRLLAVKYLVLIIFNHPTAKRRTLYTSTNGLRGRPADNPANSVGFGDSHRTVPELTVRVYLQPAVPRCQQFGSDWVPDLK